MIKIIPPPRAIPAPKRNADKYGGGYYHAPRGRKLHKGVDYACVKGSIILSPNAGEITKIGWPYSPADKKKGHLRYV